MWKLKLFFKDELIGELILEFGNEYIVGRSSQCDLTLKEGAKISRRHIKIYDKDGRWFAEDISRHGLMFKGKEFISSIEAEDGLCFSIPLYELRFVKEDFDRTMVIFQEPSENKDDDSDTVITQAPLQGFLNILTVEGRQKEFSIDKKIVLVGSSPESDLILLEPEILEKHFEIHHREDHFILHPFGEMSLNGESLDLDVEKEIQSGDCLTVGSSTLFFYEKNKDFQNEVSSLVNAVEKSDWTSVALSSSGPSVFEEPSRAFYRRPLVKKIAGAGLAVLILSFFFSLSPKKQKTTDTESNPYSHLTEAQRTHLKHAFELAYRQYYQRRYSLCLVELEKIHNIVSSYKSSKALLINCQNGLQALQQEEVEQRREREMKLVEAKVKSIIGICEDKLLDFQTEEELNLCLGEALELDPNFEGIDSLRTQVRMRAERKKEEEEEKRRYLNLVAEGERRYRKALSYKKYSVRRAILELKKYINSSYPDPNSYKAKAKRNLASLDKSFQRKIGENLKNCTLYLKKENFRRSHQHCQAVLKEDPENKKALELADSLKSLRRKKMKDYYSDATIEEGFGNFDIAKEKWKKILEEDIPEGEYYKKAKRRMKKYGFL